MNAFHLVTYVQIQNYTKSYIINAILLTVLIGSKPEFFSSEVLPVFSEFH